MKKSGVSSFLSNLWYYHKWHILFGAFVLMFAAFSVSQCADRAKADVGILYIGGTDIGEKGREDIERNFCGCCSDIDGDGKNIVSVTFMNKDDPDTKRRLQTEVLAGDHSVFFADKENFDWLAEHEVLAPLAAVLGEKPENALNDYGIELKYLDISETGGFSAMPRNTVVCLRGNADGDIDYGQSDELYKNSVGFFTELFSYKKEGLEREDLRLTLIGDRDLNEKCVGLIEESLYHICKRSNPDSAAILVYESMQLKYGEDGAHVFGDEEKRAAEELAEGNKLLLLDADVFEYLASEGLLFDIGGLSCALPESAGQYGARLTSLPLFETDGFCYADDRSDGRIYLCAGVGAGDRTRQVLGILYGFKFD